MKRPGMIKRLLIGTLAAGALLGGASAALSPATADAGTRVTEASTQQTDPNAGFPYYGCIVTGDNVNFRTADGTSLGQVHHGQKMNTYEHVNGKYGGYLWGDGRYVFVSSDFVACQG